MSTIITLDKEAKSKDKGENGLNFQNWYYYF